MSATQEAIQQPPPIPYASRIPDAPCCQRCGTLAPTKQVEFHQHIGALIIMFHKRVPAKLCRNCISEVFWQFTLVTLVAGWWGLLSFFITPFCLIWNVIVYLSSRSLAAAPAGAQRAVPSQPPPLNRAPVPIPPPIRPAPIPPPLNR